MDLVLQRFFHNEAEMGAFGAIAVEVFSFILMPFERVGKHCFCLSDLHPDLRQVGKLHRRTVLIDQRFDVEIIILQISVFYIKIFLWKIEGLIYEVAIRIIHLEKQGLGLSHFFNGTKL
jgi:hypothetical protein